MTPKFKLVEDLLWVLTSPSLITTSAESDPASKIGILDKLDTIELFKQYSAEALNTLLAQHLTQSKSHFLGPYFEQLWEFYLTHHPSYNLIASNLQVHNKTHTLGEFDFLVQENISGRFYHQELAIKFYLGHQENDRAWWIGPQTVDRLDKKMSHLSNHQLKLSQLPEAQTALHKLGIKQTYPQLLMKGYLFQPLHLDTVTTPNYINPQHNRGFWLPKSLFLEQISKGKYSQSHWQILHKQEWFSQQGHLDQQRIFASHELKPELDFSRPILLSRINFEDHQAQEVEKLFVVSDDWPHLTKTSPTL